MQGDGLTDSHIFTPDSGISSHSFGRSYSIISPTNLNRDHSLWKIRSGDIKSFKESYTTVSDHLDQIMSKKNDTPMFQNQFHLSAYIPKQTMNAADLIEATRL